ncbi:MAG: hypothetical protein ABIE74_12820 [Pseudomonadota bacterium]
MTKKYLVSLVCVILFISPVAQSAKYVANFQYKPDFQNPPDSAGLTIAVGKAEYKSGMQDMWYNSPEFVSLDQAIKDDLSEILKAKGFSVKGPFTSKKISKSQRKTIDLLLVPTVELVTSTPPVYRLNDVKVEVKGKITLKLEDVATHEIIWSSSIPFPLITSLECKDPSFWNKINQINWQDPSVIKTIDDEKVLKNIASVDLKPEVMNDVARGLEKQYPDLMASMAKMLDPEEIKALKKETQAPVTPSFMEKVEPYVATFAYKPLAQKAPGSQGVSFAVAKITPTPSETPDQLWRDELSLFGKIDQAGDKMFWYSFAQFTNMGTKLRRDIAELLFAKGFKVRGPFDYYEAISPADKKSIDYYLIPKIEMMFTTRDVKKASSITTHVEVGATITMEIRDMKNFALLLMKKTAPIKIDLVCITGTTYEAENKYNYIMNETVRGIEQQYSALMSDISKLLASQEIKPHKKQSQGKTGY